MNYNAGDYYVYKGKLCPPEVTLGCFCQSDLTQIICADS